MQQAQAGTVIVDTTENPDSPHRIGVVGDGKRKRVPEVGRGILGYLELRRVCEEMGHPEHAGGVVCTTCWIVLPSDRH